MDNNTLNQFMKKAEKANLRRSNLVHSQNRRSYIILAIASAVAIGTYGMSLYSISRSKHLDDSFDRVPDYKPGKY